MLRSGVESLLPLLSQAGFVFSMTSQGRSSGGAFAQGEFRKGNRVLELSYRHSLGNVAYTVKCATLAHEDYMWANGHAGQYPGFPGDDLNPFERLCADLVLAGGAFLVQPEAEFARLVEKCQARPAKRGLGSLGEPR